MHCKLSQTDTKLFSSVKHLICCTTNCRAWRIADRHIRHEELASRWAWTSCMEIPEIKDCTTSQWPTFHISRLQAKTACEKKWQSQSHAYSHRSSHPSCEITHRTSIPQHRLKRLLKRDFNIQTQSVANKHEVFYNIKYNAVTRTTGAVFQYLKVAFNSNACFIATYQSPSFTFFLLGFDESVAIKRISVLCDVDNILTLNMQKKYFLW